jgi:CDGSH iron-sulfur domain-containing protein 3
MDDESDYTHLFPIRLEVVQGKEYFWCSCGESKTPPLCDKTECGSKAVKYVADLSEEVCFCNCKQTKNPPWCDGSHAKVLLEVVRKRQQKNEL